VSIQSATEQHHTLNAPSRVAEDRWQLYPVWTVDEQGVCACRKQAACGSPGKHPATPHGINDASSDPERIRELFAAKPGANLGLRTGTGSGVVVLDVDPRHGGREALKRLQAEHRSLPGTRLHETGGGGWHYLFALPDGVGSVSSRTLDHGVELKADGAGVVLPPSRHASGETYGVLSWAALAPVPAWMLDLARRPELTVIEGEGRAERTETRFGLPERIHEGAPSRNRTLYGYGCSLRAHGWDYASILTELRRTNEDRCTPPMSDDEVRKVAGSAARHAPGNASTVSPEVLATVAYLKQRADSRPKTGVAAHSRWAVYRALLDNANRHGRMHRDRDIAVSISVRDLALSAGVSKPTALSALKALEKSRLVYRISGERGANSGVLALRVPLRRAPTFTTRTTPQDSRKEEKDGALYQLRQGYGIGKATGEVLEKVVERGETGIGRGELAGELGKKPESLRRSLKRLVELGLIERLRRGTYRAVQNWRRVLERERVMSGEAKSENLDRAAYARQRERFREVLARRKENR